MSKLGDLIVKLRLDGKDYQKGLKNAEAKTKGMAGQFGKIVGGIKMGWAAIGAAVVAVGGEMIRSTNKFGDAWNRTMGGAKSAWQTLKTSVMSWDFKNLGSKMKESYATGKELADTLDGVFEVENSLKLVQAKNQSQLEAYRQDLMDTNLAVEERIKAGENYLAFMKKQADTEIALRKKVRDAVINDWLSKTGVKATSGQVQEFFMGYTGEDSAVAKKYPQLANNYLMQNDQANGSVVDAIYNVLNASSQWEVENRRIIHSVRELRAELEGEKDLLEELLKVIDPVVLEDGFEAVADTINFSALDTSVDSSAVSDYVDNWEAQVNRFQELAARFRDACIYGFSDGAQYMMDALFGLEQMNAGQLLNTLLAPLADMAIREGEILIAQGVGVEACKKALESLNGYAAIAAGVALVGIGAAAKSGLQRLASGRSGASYGGEASASSSSGTFENISTELTIRVEGRLSGNDILLAGQRAQKSLAR